MISTKSSIVLQTRKGNDIKNEQINDPFTIFQNNQNDETKIKHPKATFRCDPTKAYNCHGMVFASRRTGIYEGSEIEKILQDDGYEKVDNPNDVLPGDILIYMNSTSGDFEHSALVISEPDAKCFGLPRVLSKWGSSYEVIHYANDCPYNCSSIQYYRLTR